MSEFSNQAMEPVAEQSHSKSYRNRIISVVSVSLVMAGAGLMVSAASGGKTNSAADRSLSNFAESRQTSSDMLANLPLKDMPQVDAKKAPSAPAVDETRGAKTAPGVDTKVVKVKPTVKPTAAPKPTEPPKTGKPAEKKHADETREEGPKGMSPRKLMAPAKETKAQAPKKTDGPVSPVVPDDKEEVRGSSPNQGKKSKPTIKPTAAPKPTEPPKTGKPAEKKHVDEAREEGPKGAAPKSPSRMLSEVRGKVTPSKSAVRGSSKTEKPVEPSPPGPHGPEGRAAAGPRQLSEKTASGVSQAAKNAIYGIAGPTKSPSTGLHKPTWKPTAGTPTGKPLEQGSSSSSSSGSRSGSSDVKEDVSEVPETEASASREAGPKGEKKVLAHDGATRSLREKKNVETDRPGYPRPTMSPKTDKPAEHRRLSATFKPNEKKTSKPAEKKSSIGAALPRNLADIRPPQGVDAKHPTAAQDIVVADPGPPHVSTPTMTPRTSTKPVESKVNAASAQMHDGVKATRPAHQDGEEDPEGRHLSGYKAASPTKSPSTGLHKPTWKPSSKPAEHRTLQDAAAVAPVRPAAVDGAAPAPKAAGAAPAKTGPAPVAALYMKSGYKAASPTKSPSTGLHKPTWKPSSKPAERR